MTKPSDIGYDDDGFILPQLTIKPIFVESEYLSNEHLFFTGLSGLGDRAGVRADAIPQKIKVIKELINPNEQTIIWCGLDKESKTIAKELKGISNSFEFLAKKDFAVF